MSKRQWPTKLSREWLCVNLFSEIPESVATMLHPSNYKATICSDRLDFWVAATFKRTSLDTDHAWLYGMCRCLFLKLHQGHDCWTNRNTQTMSLTSACCVHSNVHGLGNIHWIRYLTVVDPIHSTSSTVQAYHHLTSVSVEVPLVTTAWHSSSIGEVPLS